MFTDIILPQDNITEFLAIAKKLGYNKLIVGCKEKSTIQNIVDDIQIQHGLLVKSAPHHKKDITILKADYTLRDSLERGTICLIYAQEELEKRDKLHYRAGGLNHILCKIAYENKVSIGFSFNSILKAGGTKRAIILGRMRQNVMLCRKFKLNMVIGSFGTSPYEMRDPRDLISFGLVLGMQSHEAKNSVMG